MTADFFKLPRMAKSRNSVVLVKLARDSRAELESMVAELSGVRSDSKGTGTSSVRWSRRFAASGKDGFAPKLRLF